MVGIFTPINNSRGYEIREFTMVNGIPRGIRAVRISDYIGVIDELKIYKPKKFFSNKREYWSQFREINPNELTLF